jgi:hypothetical protein
VFELLTTLLRSAQGGLEFALAANALAPVLLLGALGAAAVELVETGWRSDHAHVADDPSGASARLRQTVDPARLISQSDPDAAGRPRPRAPGRGIRAA